MQLHTFLKYLTSLYKERVWSRKSIATISNLAYFVFWRSFVEERIYRVIHKSLREFRPLRYSSRDAHAEGEHVNRGRDTPIFCPTLQVLDMSTLGEVADVNPVIKFLPHTCKVCGRNVITGLSFAASPTVDISSTCKVGQKLGVPLPLLTCSPSAWPNRLLYLRGRRSRRDVWITLYKNHYPILQVWKEDSSSINKFNNKLTKVLHILSIGKWF